MTVTARNPVRMAKELATIDRLSGGRLLLVFVPGLTNRQEDQALGVPVNERGAWLDEILPLARRLWSEDNVAHNGPLFCYEGISLQPRPLQNPLEVWLGGNAKSALRRAGRLSDGWLPSLCTPEEAAAGRAAIEVGGGRSGAAYRSRALRHQHDLCARRDSRLPGGAHRPAAAGPRSRDVRPGGSRGAARHASSATSTLASPSSSSRPAETPAAWQDELDELAEGVLSLQT